jgi:hypothetical protein
MNPFTDADPRETMTDASTGSTWHPHHHLRSVASCSSLSSQMGNDESDDKRPELSQTHEQPTAAAGMLSIITPPCPPSANLRGDKESPEKVFSCFVKHFQVDTRHRSETFTAETSEFNKKSPIGQGQRQGQNQEAFPPFKSGVAVTSNIPLVLRQMTLEQPHSKSQFQSQSQPQSRSQSQSQSSRRVSGTHGAVSRLHRLCCRKSATVSEVKAILAIDPEAIRRRAAVRTLNQAGSKHEISHAHTHAHAHAYAPRQLQREPLTFPLNLAIHHKVSSEVILFLLDVDPTVCLKPDGRMFESSLHILLRIGRRHDLFQLVDTFLKVNPACAWTTDGRDQVPLHVTVAFGAELNVVRRLCTAHPQALRVRNRCGHTVMDMAGYRHFTCPPAVAEYLWQFTTLVQEKETQEFDDSLLFP